MGIVGSVRSHTGVVLCSRETTGSTAVEVGLDVTLTLHCQGTPKQMVADRELAISPSLVHVREGRLHIFRGNH